jgi:ferredoxin--NADP+ reductase
MAFLSFANISSQRVRKEEKAICNSRSCLRKCNSFVPLQFVVKRDVSGPKSYGVRMAAPASSKREVPLNIFRPNKPFEATCISNELIVGKDAPGETWHMIFNTDGALRYIEGQSIGVIPPGQDEKGKPHKVRLYSIASTSHGDHKDDKTLSLCVKRLVYTDPSTGEEKRGVCSNYLCDLKPNDKVKISGPVGTVMLMPEDPKANIIMLATGTGIAPFRAFLLRAFMENNPDYQFEGKMWLFFGVPTTSSLLYREELDKMVKENPDRLRIDYAISREQKDGNGKKMYIQNRMAEYKEELYDLLHQPNTYTYMCGLKGMESGLDEVMGPVFEERGENWEEFRKQLKKEKHLLIETY